MIQTQKLMGLLLLAGLVLSSAISVVYVKHLNRSLHIQLQQLQGIRDKLHIEWTQLLLERGTLGSDIQKIARDNLGMIMPSKNQIVVIQP